MAGYNTQSKRTISETEENRRGMQEGNGRLRCCFYRATTMRAITGSITLNPNTDPASGQRTKPPSALPLLSLSPLLCPNCNTSCNRCCCCCRCCCRCGTFDCVAINSGSSIKCCIPNLSIANTKSLQPPSSNDNLHNSHHYNHNDRLESACGQTRSIRATTVYHCPNPRRHS
jgi:hypothetical protein